VARRALTHHSWFLLKGAADKPETELLHNSWTIPKPIQYQRPDSAQLPLDAALALRTLVT